MLILVLEIGIFAKASLVFHTRVPLWSCCAGSLNMLAMLAISAHPLQRGDTTSACYAHSHSTIPRFLCQTPMYICMASSYELRIQLGKLRVAGDIPFPVI